MNLTTKALLIVGGMLLALSCTVLVVANQVLYGGFVDLERQSAVADAERGVNALRGVANHVSQYVRDYATWDDTANYLQGRDDAFITDNMDPVYHAGQDTNYTGVFRLDRTIAYTMGYTSDGTLDEGITAAVDVFLRDTPAFFEAAMKDESPISVAVTPSGPMLVAGRAVHNTDGKGGPYGCYVVGRLINQEFIDNLGRGIQVQVDIWNPDDPAHSDTSTDAQPVLSGAEPVKIQTIDDKLLRVLTRFTDFQDRPVLLLSADVPRLITAEGRTLIRSSILLFLPGAVLVTGIVMLVLQRTILRPLVQLTRHVETIGEGKSADVATRLQSTRSDEIGRLTREFDHMLTRLSETQSNLVSASRLAGMADVATSVLHNVGNVLNSINVAATLLRDRLQQSRLGSLSKATELLRQPREDLAGYLTHDPQGKQLVDFLGKLSQVLTSEQESMVTETRGLIENVNHVKNIVNMQQSMARTVDVIEPFDLSGVIEDALKINQAGITRHNVTVAREFTKGLIVETDRQRVLQILVNLISNAKYAVSECDVNPKKVIVRARRQDSDYVVVEVSDTGMGIPAENMTKLFAYGFTTRKHGHGFGLHTSALSANEIGGELKVASDGPNCGATFSLRIPIAMPRSDSSCRNSDQLQPIAS